MLEGSDFGLQELLLMFQGAGVTLAITFWAVLGGTFYSLTLDIPLYWNNVKPLASVDDGVNLYTVNARQAFDGTNGLVATLVSSLAAIP